MNQALVDRIANTLLYEGYILYPYRPSIKNRQRWNFGGLYPPAYCRPGGADSWQMQTECLVLAGPRTRLDVRVRFLHLVQRTVGRTAAASEEPPQGVEPAFQPVPSLLVGARQYHTWQEAIERETLVEDIEISELTRHPQKRRFSFPAGRQWEPLRDATGQTVGVLVREQQAVEGTLKVSAEPVQGGLFRLRVHVANATALNEVNCDNRDQALLRAFASTHTILTVRQGAFVSLLDPPECFQRHASECQNIGTWPVLVGESGATDTLLSSPIILYDYPQVAPESPGDLFDNSEIDEMLTLRILTLTDEEKEAMASMDDRARALLDRTEALSGEQLLQLHGTIRGLRPAMGEER